ncbi:MAG: Response regulator [Parcubacteria group bacterium GW2011_GWC1_45_9]|nr:MAG: Response regulator [Parcubacteria group bacterium GW2011_GWC1_45_9]
MEQTQNPSAPKILIVEDDLFLANLLSLRFKKENFEVVQAFSGNEALKKLEELRPDIILLDIILPQKNGFEVLESISQNPQTQNIPVIIVSNLGQESDIEKGKMLGAMDYYVKARLSIDELVAKVKNLVSTAKAA